MQVYSREEAADHSAANAIAGAVEGPLERSCTERDRILVAPELAGIERIEARFHGKGFEPHRHDTYALGVTMAGVQTFSYRGEARFSPPGNVIVLHPDEMHDGGRGHRGRPHLPHDLHPAGAFPACDRRTRAYAALRRRARH
jgi:hypothetical protein